MTSKGHVTREESMSTGERVCYQESREAIRRVSGRVLSLLDITSF